MKLYEHEMSYIIDVIGALSEFYNRTYRPATDIEVGWEYIEHDLYLPIVAVGKVIGYVGYTDDGEVGFMESIPEQHNDWLLARNKEQ